jgi:hypothetical protein
LCFAKVIKKLKPDFFNETLIKVNKKENENEQTNK